jgi:HD superfamily phosphohydrolase YqeK
VDEIREAAQQSLEMAILTGIDRSIAGILDKRELLHPRTVETRNWALNMLESGKAAGRITL